MVLGLNYDYIGSRIDYKKDMANTINIFLFLLEILLI